MQVEFTQHIILSNGPNTDRIASMGIGTAQKGGKLAITTLEAVFLHKKNSIILVDGRMKPLTDAQIARKASKYEPNFFVREAVFAELRSRGYIIKTALKYGADFRAYERGVKLGEGHAKWIVFPVHEREAHRWRDFSGKNRIAHSTNKRLLLAIVDDEGDVTYFEVRWIRP